MRHKDARSTNRYYHESVKNLLDAVKLIDGPTKKGNVIMFEETKADLPKVQYTFNTTSEGSDKT